MINFRSLLFLIILSLFSSFNIVAQESILKNSSWDAFTWVQTGQSFFTVKYNNDTFIDSKRYMQFEGDKFQFAGSGILRIEGDKVYTYSTLTKEEYLTYDWSLKKNNTLVLGTPKTIVYLKLSIDSVYSKNILGKVRRIQKVSSNSDIRWKMEIIEDIGIL